MVQRRVYAKPPIQEAICDIRYTEQDLFDVRAFPDFLAALPTEFSGPVTPVFELQAKAESSGTGSGRTTVLTTGTSGPCFQVRSADGRLMVTLGKDHVSAHALAPYCGWELFRQQTLAAHAAFTQVWRPQSIARIGVRYINRVVVPLTNIDISEYFIGIPIVAMQTATMSRVLTRIEGQIDTGDSFGVTFGSAESAADEAVFLLDVEVFRLFQTQPIETTETESQLDRLRTEQRDLFEALITDKSRALFDA